MSVLFTALFQMVNDIWPGHSDEGQFEFISVGTQSPKVHKIDDIWFTT